MCLEMMLGAYVLNVFGNVAGWLYVECFLKYCWVLICLMCLKMLVGAYVLNVFGNFDV